jgi:hypothetical protein
LHQTVNRLITYKDGVIMAEPFQKVKIILTRTVLVTYVAEVPLPEEPITSTLLVDLINATFPLPALTRISTH